MDSNTRVFFREVGNVEEGLIYDWRRSGGGGPAFGKGAVLG